MKTSSTPVIQYSGYPLKILEATAEDEVIVKMPFAPKRNFNQNFLLDVAAADLPASWDEAWFGNYE